MRDAEAFARMMLAREPAGPTADYIRWRLQPGAPAANGKPLVLDSLATEALTWIALTSFDDGVGVSIGRRALHIRSLRPATEAQRVERLLSLHANALNAGRPGEALAISSMVREVQPDSGYYLRLRVLAGLYGDGDRRAAEQAASALLAMQTSDARTRALNRCVAAQLRSDVAVPETADTALELRACMAVVRVLRARPGTAAWRQAMTRAEELYRAGPLEVYRGEGYVDAIPLVLARQFVANGEPHKALQTLRRRPYFIGWHPYMAASLLEEGRLAEQLGQLHTAQRAYAHYLALRSNPDEPLRAITDSLRQKVR